MSDPEFQYSKIRWIGSQNLMSCIGFMEMNLKTYGRLDGSEYVDRHASSFPVRGDYLSFIVQPDGVLALPRFKPKPL